MSGRCGAALADSVEHPTRHAKPPLLARDALAACVDSSRDR
jgi:hypothetical protein